MPVYVRSGVDRVWVVGLPEGLLTSSGLDKMEVPFARFELVGPRERAEEWAREFLPYARMYAENLQSGLPIRSDPDNGARLLYRLREGEIIKVIGPSDRGVPPLGVTGEPLPGRWYRVLAEDGTIGYSFSYRLRLFEPEGALLFASGIAPGLVSASAVRESPASATDLDILLSRTWAPESYLAMINSGRIDLDELSRRWHFTAGRDNNVARLALPGVNLSFPYSAIVPSGNRAWQFEGSALSAQLRTDSNLIVQFAEGGSVRTFSLVALPVDIETVINREVARRANLYNAIVRHGPAFASGNFGAIHFGSDGTFTWSGFDLLVPQHIPRAAQGQGVVSMDLFLAPALAERHSGAFTMRFQGSGGGEVAALRAMYTLDSQGLRLEIVPDASVDGVTVARSSASPMVLFFFARDEIADAGATETDDLF